MKNRKGMKLVALLLAVALLMTGVLAAAEEFAVQAVEAPDAEQVYFAEEPVEAEAESVDPVYEEIDEFVLGASPQLPAPPVSGGLTLETEDGAELPQEDFAEELFDQEAAGAYDADGETVHEAALPDDFPYDAMGENGDLFATWLSLMLPEASRANVPMAGPREGRAMLSGATLALYDVLAPQLEAVANGSRTSTVFTFTAADLRLSGTWYKLSDLGVADAGAPELGTSLMQQENLNTNQLWFAILMDFPYELYWFDKTNGGMSESTSFVTRVSEGQTEVRLDTFTVSMTVAADYAADIYTVNALPARVAAAKANINAIVADNAGKGDYDKVCAYADAICFFADYNDEAAANNGSMYGDPWQLVSVFDGDVNTKVVCEGYAKAFKYLCDLSTFQSNMGVVLMEGNLMTPDGGGPHMWNVIAMPDGRFYMADVTNSEGGDRCSGARFLKGVSGEAGGPYTCAGFTYTLYDYVASNYGEGSPWLNLSHADYGQQEPIVDPNRERSPEWQQLQARIDAAGDGEIIALSGDVTAMGGDESLFVPAGKSLTLDLAGHTINRNLSAASDVGSAIEVRGALTVADRVGGGRITGGWSSMYGGGVYVNGGSLALVGGTIAGNRAYCGGGVGMPEGYFAMSGGAVSGNQSDASGGGVCVYGGGMVLSGGEIAGNASVGYGGGVYLSGDSTLDIQGGIITGNRVLQAICLSNGQPMPSRGGGIAAVRSGSITMSGGEISANLSNDTLGLDTVYYADGTMGKCRGGGVAILYGTPFTMTGGVISYNASPQGGGVLVEDASFDMKGGTIMGNRSGVGGGVLVYACTDADTASFTLENGEIINNTTFDGGGVYVRGTNLNASFTMLNGMISGNQAKDQMGVWDGGGVFLYHGRFDMKGGEIKANYARRGGGVYGLHSSMEMSGGSIHSNSVSDRGGGINITGRLALYGGAVNYNEAFGDNTVGGGVYIGQDTSEFVMSGGTISGNRCTREGAGVSSYAPFTMSGGEISYNEVAGSSGYGGGFGGGVANSADFTMTGGSINGNVSSGQGGGVASVGNFTMTGGVITGNVANKANMPYVSGGGGVAMSFAGLNMNISGSPVVAGNYEYQNGTAVDSNVLLNNWNSNTVHKINIIGPLGVEARIGVSTDPEYTGNITIGLGAGGNIGVFSSDSSSYNLARSADGNEAALQRVVVPAPAPAPVPAPAPAPAPAPDPAPAYPLLSLPNVKNNGTVTLSVGEQRQIVPAFATNAGLSAMSYSSSKPAVATVNGTGVLTASAEGKTKITVKTASKNVNATVTIQVVDPYKPSAVGIAQGKAVTVSVGQPLQLNAVLVPETAQATLTWTSGKAAVASVDAGGFVTPLAEGKAKITVTTHNKKKAVITVNVVDPYKPSAVGIAQGKAVTVSVGQPLQLNAVLAPETAQATLTWTSSKAAVASVDAGGFVTPLAEGKTKITVTTHNKKKAVITVQVVDPYKPTGIGIAQGKAVTLTVGQPVQLYAALAPETAQATLTWTSNKPAVASVDANGWVAPQGEGKAKITVTTHNKKKATIAVTVVDPNKPLGIGISQGKAITLKVGEGVQLWPVMNPATAQSALTWISGKPAVATVDANGYVAALKKGKAKITVTTYNKKKAVITVNVVE